MMTPWGLSQAIGFDFAVVEAKHWASLVAYALAASVVTVWLWMRGLQDVPAAKAGVVTLFLPLSAAAVGVAFLGEALTPLHWAALGLALTGLTLATWPDRAQAT
jgi:drug/metabolite transporter (DMT)-like permease